MSGPRIELINTVPEPLKENGESNVYYFASPYSSPFVRQREGRYTDALIAACELYEQNYCVIEPIGMSHHAAKVGNLPTGYEYWKARDRAFIDASAGTIVLCIPGWWDSVGVSDEIAYTFEKGKRVWLYNTNFQGSRSFEELDKSSYLAAKTAQVQ